MEKDNGSFLQIEDPRVQQLLEDQDYFDYLAEKNNLNDEDYFGYLISKKQKSEAGKARAVLQGASLGFADEAEALIAAASRGSSYEEELESVRSKIKEFSEDDPVTALIAEVAGGSLTGAGLAKALAKKGIGLVGSGAVEGGIYGAGVGESFEGRTLGAIGGTLAGATIGAVANRATSEPTDALADTLQSKNTRLPFNDREADNAFIDKDIFDLEQYTPVESPAFRRKPLSEAQTAGELYEGVKASVAQWYNDKIRGVSDTLWAEVAPEVGAKYQRGNQAALLKNSRALESFGKELPPAIKTINENEEAVGLLLDYGAGYLRGGKSELLVRLKKLLTKDELKAVDNYLTWSAKKNRDLNTEVFGVSFKDKTYLHTRLNKEQLARLKKERNLTDDQLEDLIEGSQLYDDPAFELRTRSRYTDNPRDPKRPNPFDYDNPIISDMQRIFRMEQLYQMKRMYGVDVNYMARMLNRGLTPSEFMDGVAITLKNKGIPDDAATFARKLMVDDVMGSLATPHPIVQALSSIAYATTLAGPMSAVLNMADVPLVGAKYGREAVKEGFKSAVPQGFKKVPDVDLKELGMNNQNFGEFLNLIRPDLVDPRGFLQKTASAFRQGTDVLMKGSGFAAMDQVGKKGVMRGVLKSAADDAQAGKLADNWGFYFNDRELDILENAFIKHGDDWTKYEGRAASLAEELMFAGLGQQQLISSAGRSAAWSRNPNLRPLWALRGFVIKQQAIALREVVGNLKAGKPEEAAKFLGRYAAYGAGGYAIINEGRQFIFGDGNVSAEGLLRGYGDSWASLLTANTLGLNDYQFGKIKQNGILMTFAEGLMPIAIDRPADIIGRAADVIDSKRYARELVADTFPIAKQSARLLRNIDEKTGGMLGPLGQGAETFLERKPQER